MLDENLSQLITEMTSIAMTDYSAYEYLYSNYDNLFSEYNDADPTEIINKLMGTATDHYPDMGKISYTAKKLDKSLEDIQENTLAYYMSPAIDDQDNNLIRVMVSIRMECGRHLPTKDIRDTCYKMHIICQLIRSR